MYDGATSNNSHSHSAKLPPKLPITEAVKVLLPAGKSRHHLQFLDKEQSRFSQLLLEHGEKHLQDWAVIAYSSKAHDEKDMLRQGSSSGRGRSSSHNHHHHASGRTAPTKTQWEQNPATAQASATPPRHRSQTQPQQTPHSKHTTHNNNNNSSLESQYPEDAFPSTHMAKIEGRLHLCSRSIVFEPNDASRGIVRCPFRKMDGAPQEYPPVDDTNDGLGERFDTMCIDFRSHHHFVMKEHAAPAPFTAVPVPVDFRFTFLHSSPAPFVELCQKLFALWKKYQHSASRMTHELPELEELLQPMLERPFHMQHLVDVRERILTPTSLQASLWTPLQRKPGCVVATTERIYFQPASGAITPTETKAMHWMVRNVVATACRYNGLQDCAIELYFSDASSVLLAFERKRDREQLLRFLPRNAWSFTDRDFVVAVVQAWYNHQLSNYDYLLALNAAAGRSFHDLSRYPVFPWILKDYQSSTLDWDHPEKIFRDLSQPVGALSPERLNYFQTRLEGMQDMEDTFLYGTHYSTPGYVLYFLVRSMPEQMLCLQNGRWKDVFICALVFFWFGVLFLKFCSYHFIVWQASLMPRTACSTA